MKILRSFAKSENAHLLATLLRDNGIDAYVIDDSAYGGNILGAIKNSIRIEVPEDQLDRALEVLAAADENADQGRGREDG